MKRVTVHNAKIHLPALPRDIVEGEEVIIARGDLPVAQIVPIEGATNVRKASGARDVLLSIADDFDTPLEDFGNYAP